MNERGQKYKIAIENENEDEKRRQGKGAATQFSYKYIKYFTPWTLGPSPFSFIRGGKLLVSFTDGIFGLFRIDPQMERVDRLYALSLFNPETVGDALNPGIGIDTCDLDASGSWLAFGSAKLVNF